MHRRCPCCCCLASNTVRAGVSTYIAITAQLINSKKPEVLPKIGLTDLEYCYALESFPHWPFGSGFCLYISCEYGKQGDLGSNWKSAILCKTVALRTNPSYSNSEYPRPKEGAKERRANMVYPFDRQLITGLKCLLQLSVHLV